VYDNHKEEKLRISGKRKKKKADDRVKKRKKAVLPDLEKGTVHGESSEIP